jgi:hypothetical protein
MCRFSDRGTLWWRSGVTLWKISTSTGCLRFRLLADYGEFSAFCPKIGPFYANSVLPSRVLRMLCGVLPISLNRLLAVYGIDCANTFFLKALCTILIFKLTHISSELINRSAVSGFQLHIVSAVVIIL